MVLDPQDKVWLVNGGLIFEFAALQNQTLDADFSYLILREFQYDRKAIMLGNSFALCR
jgi:hypothetical protein